ncbi:hypothetical protein FHS25_006598 [Rhizobium laguerreae]|uniref:Uncharacterized protein n=1 Tax=Rhizobium laguerreae TaxID=1076926 RepID=A0ABR6GL41_9HYPH|nr:hypothetical protein [Rhizobium laguerreae]
MLMAVPAFAVNLDEVLAMDVDEDQSGMTGRSVAYP